MFDTSNKPRIIYTYTLPPELTQLEDPYIKTSFGMVKLSMQDEITATGASANNAAKVAYGFARAALVEVDGRLLNKADGEDEEVIRNTDPIIRAGILEAYTNLHTVPEGVTKKLVASRTMRTA